jgi:hypothetical protein
MTDWGTFRQRTAPQPEYNNGSPPFLSNPTNASLNHSQSTVISETDDPKYIEGSTPKEQKSPNGVLPNREHAR